MGKVNKKTCIGNKTLLLLQLVIQQTKLQRW